MTICPRTAGTAVKAAVAASDTCARASSSGPSRTIPGPNSAKNSATAASAMLMAEAPSTRVKASTASSPMMAVACSKADMRPAMSSETSPSSVDGIPAAWSTRSTQATGTPCRSAITPTGTVTEFGRVDQVAGQPGKTSRGVCLDHLLRRGPPASEELEERSALFRPGVGGIVEPGPLPVLGGGADAGQRAHSSVAPGCGRTMPLRAISRWAVNSNSPEPATSCSERDETRISPGAATSANLLATMTVCPRTSSPSATASPVWIPMWTAMRSGLVPGVYDVERLLDVHGAAQGSCRSAERDHEPVALDADLSAALAPDGLPDDPVVLVEQLP